jgi:hypothetical protein
VQGMYQNDFLGLTFENSIMNGKPVGPPITETGAVLAEVVATTRIIRLMKAVSSAAHVKCTLKKIVLPSNVYHRETRYILLGNNLLDL